MVFVMVLERDHRNLNNKGTIQRVYSSITTFKAIIKVEQDVNEMRFKLIFKF